MRTIWRSAGIVCLALVSGTLWAQVAGENINMVSGTQWPSGDPFLQRQNEPSMAVSSRNPEHLLAGANDYRTVDIPNTQSPNETGDAWLGVFTSMDGGETWKSTLLPGYPQDTSAIGMASPLHQFTVATDPTVRAGTHGLFYVSGLAFNRGSGSPSGVFVSVFQDQNNKGNGNAAILQGSSGAQSGNPFAYIGATLLDTGTSGQFLDKPWVAVDIPRSNRTATCKVGGQTIQSGYAYAVWTQFNGSKNNPSSKIKVSTSTNCGATWTQPQTLSQSEKLAQGTVATIDPSNGNVHIAWRQIAIAGNQNQPDAIQYAYSTNGGNSFVWTNPVHTFSTSSTSFPPGSVFDQPSGAEFRTLDVPSIAVDGSSRVWIAYSQRVNGPTSGTYGSRIMVTTLPSGASAWTTPYVVDKSSPTTTAYGHQFMPALSFAFGKMMLAWFDSRNDNKETVLSCTGAPCTNLSQLSAQSIPIPGSTIATAGPASVFTANILDPNSGIRHTIDVFGALIDPPTQTNTAVPSFQISQYPFWVNDADNEQIEQGFFNPPNLPMFAQGTLPFVGDYIDIGVQNIVPSGTGWSFNVQGKDSATGATLAPDFHITWTDNRDVVPPPVVSGGQNWALYAPPNSGNSTSSVYFGNGSACPTCSTVQPACTLVPASDGTESAYSGDRNENVYTSRISNGLIVRFRENAKQLSSTVPTRSFSLLVKKSVNPLNTTPPGAPSFYRIMLGVTSTTQTPTCAITGGTASLSASGCTPFIDVAVNPKTTFTQSITINSSATAPSVPVLVAQESSIPAQGAPPVFLPLQALATINSDPSNPLVANPDFLSTDNSNPDASSPYGALSISAGETYDPAVDGAPDPTINTPKIAAPLINTPKIGTLANNTPKISTPTIVTVGINTPKIASVQVVNPTIVDTINTPKINTPKINTPKIVSPQIFAPKITAPPELTDYTWNVTNKGNTSSSYNTTEFLKSSGVQCCPASCSANPSSCQVTPTNPAGPNCSVCQLIQHKVYESPVANRDSTTGNPTCDLNVQQESIVVANISDPAFITGGIGGGNPSDPTNSTLSLSPGEGNRVTLRVAAPPAQQASPFKTVAAGQNPDSNGRAPISLTIQTTALPVAVVNQPYTGNQLSSVGGIGTTLWSLPLDPTNPVPVVGGGPFALPVSPLTLAESGRVSNSTVTQATGTYPFFVQVQDSATTSGNLTPTFDVEQLTILVNQFSISNVNVAINNEVGSTSYMMAGDSATVTVMVSSLGPATATSVAPTLAVNAVAGGIPSGPTPVVHCGAPTPTSATILGNSNTPQTFIFICNAVSGNGYVTFTANATGQYVNSPAATVAAIATAVSEPQLTPGSTPPNIIVDNIVPTLTFGTTNSVQSAPGWYNAPVVVPYSTGDNLSGVKSAIATSPATSTGVDGSGKGLLTLTTEGKLVNGTMTVADYARNTAPPFTSAAFNIDETLPTISGLATPSANTFGWNNTSVQVTFSCNDPNPANGPAGQQSGLAAVGGCTSPVTLTSEGMNQSASGKALDNAANSASTNVAGINIDTTPPTISGTPDRAPNANNWYSAPVTVSFLCADPNPLNGPAGQQSQIATCTPPVGLNEGANQSVPGTAVDKAGNSAGATVTGINIDQTPPVITPNSAYTPGTWTNQSVTVAFTCTDNLSGPVVTGAPNPIITGIPPLGSTLQYMQPNALTSVATITLTANTSVAGTTLNASCQDLAGNNAQPASFGPILIDTTPPTITATANLNSSTGQSYTAGNWTNQSVVVTFACTDPLSGVKPGSITGNTTYGSQGSYTANGSCQDVAGNTAAGSFGPVLIDTTTPGVLIASPTAQTYLLNQQITPNFTCGDNAGGDTVTCTTIPTGSSYGATPVGPSTFTVNAVDQANNTSSASVGYLVIYNLTGFQSPLQPAAMMNPPSPPTPPQPSDSGSFTVGATIPIAWQLQDATNTYISDQATLTSIVAIPNPACAGTASGAGTTLYNATTGQSAFSYDNTNNRFVFSWNTTGTTAGCYNLVVTTNDTAQWSTIVHLAADTFAGFDAPLSAASAPANPSNSGAFDSGSTIPVMWLLSTPSGPDSAQNVTASNVTAYQNAACSGAPQSGAPSTTLYDRSTNQGAVGFEPSNAAYTVNWVTGVAQTGCYNIVVTLSDQSVYATMVTLAAPGGAVPLLQYNFDNVPQGPGSQTAPPSFAAPNVAGGAFGYSRYNSNGMFANGCAIGDCIDPSGVASGEYYAFSLTNGTPVTNASISFWEFNNDCQLGCDSAQSFSVQYDTDAAFGNPTTVQNFVPQTPGSASYSFPISGTLPMNTYYFRIVATGTDHDGSAQYVLDNVTITGTH